MVATYTTTERAELALQMQEEHAHEMDTGPSDWERWHDAVAARCGLDHLDGDDREDGYSMDWAYSLFRQGVTVDAAVAAVRRGQVTS